MTIESTRTDPLNRQFDALRDPLRRRVLVALQECEAAEMTAATLAGDGSSTVELHHSHLPRLADAGYVEWEADPLVVRRGPAFDEIAPLLGLLGAHRAEFEGCWPDPCPSG